MKIQELKFQNPEYDVKMYNKWTEDHEETQ